MHSRSRRAFLRGIGAASFLQAVGARASAGEAVGTFPLAFAVAEENGQRVVDNAWLAAQLAEVERLYGPIGVHVHDVGARALGLPLAQLETRTDRDSLARALLRNVINVFVVASLRDVDDTSLMRRGVHWRHSHQPSQRYIILSAIAGKTVLAHELGHYFGNGHSPVVDNLMSYERTGGEVFLDANQARTIRAAAQLVLRSGEVTAVNETPAREAPRP
jgi:NAD(P)-dependent dehydrogenase (short-subunit alcohol dehydrogenase family)